MRKNSKKQAAGSPSPTLSHKKSNPFSLFSRNKAAAQTPTPAPTTGPLAPPPGLTSDPAPAPAPLPVLSLQSDGPASATESDETSLPAPATTTVSRAAAAAAASTSSEALPGETRAPTPDLDRSLALLNSQFASFHTLASVASSNRSSISVETTTPASSGAADFRVIDESEDTDDDGTAGTEGDDDRSVEVGRATRGFRLSDSSLSAFQLGAGNMGLDFGASEGGGELFGKNMLWDALGLDAEDESSEGEHFSGEPSTSTPPISPAALKGGPTGPAISSLVRSGSDLSSTSSSSSAAEAEPQNVSDDIFNLSEFPAFGDLPSFSSDPSSPETSRNAITAASAGIIPASPSTSSQHPILPRPVSTQFLGKAGARTSQIMAFPIPPPLSPPMSALPSPPGSGRMSRQPSLVSLSGQYSAPIFETPVLQTGAYYGGNNNKENKNPAASVIREESEGDLASTAGSTAAAAAPELERQAKLVDSGFGGAGAAGLGLGLGIGLGLSASSFESEDPSIAMTHEDEGPFSLEQQEGDEKKGGLGLAMEQDSMPLTPELNFGMDEAGLDYSDDSAIDPATAGYFDEERCASPDDNQSHQSHSDVLAFLTTPELAPPVRSTVTRQHSLPAIFAPPRAYAMELGSPLLLPAGTSGPPSPIAPQMEDSNSSTGDSRPGSRTSNPRSPMDLYSASLGSLRLGDENEFPMWDQLPPSPSIPLPSPGKSQKLKTTRSPSQAAKSANTKIPPPRDLSKRISFSSLKRRKSEAALSEIAPKFPSTLLTPGSESGGAGEGTPTLTKRRSRLSLYIPRFGGKKDETVPPTPSLPVDLSQPAPSTTAPAATPEVATTDPPTIQLLPEVQLLPPASPSSSMEQTPMLDPPSSAFTASSAFPGTPASSVSAQSESYFAFQQQNGNKEDAPFPSPTFSDMSQPLTLSQFVHRPARSSSVFPQSTDYRKAQVPLVVPEADLAAASMEDEDALETVSVDEKDPAKNAMREKDIEKILGLGLQEGPAAPPVDVVVFPVSLGPPRSTHTASSVQPSSGRSSRATTVSSVNDAVTEDSSAHDGGSGDSEDDVPLASKPGALKMQKSLRATSSTSRTTRRVAKRSDPFEFDSAGVSTSASLPSPPALPSPSSGVASLDSFATASPELLNSPESFAGHSLLPHSDAKLQRSPSLPLDPSIANSTLTIDSYRPSRGGRPAAPAKASTVDGLTMPSALLKKPSMGRLKPNLAIAVGAPPLDQMPPPRSPRSPGLRSRSASTSKGSANPVSAPAVASTSTLISRSNTLSPEAPAIEFKIYIGDHTKQMLFSVKPTTRCGEIVDMAKERKLLQLSGGSEEGYALWEICRDHGVERPMREHEVLADVMKTWGQESNILIIRHTALWPLLTSHLRAKPQAPRGAWVQLHQAKKSKWSKRYLELRDGALYSSKSEKGKDSTVLCQLSAFECFYVAPHIVDKLRAPKPFVFSVKSLLPRAHYEESSEYAYFIGVKTADELSSWLRSVTEARSAFVRKPDIRALDGANSPPIPANLPPPIPATTLLGGAPTRSKSVRAPPPQLAAALAAMPMSKGHSNPVPSSGDLLGARPPPAEWSAMGAEERQAWLAEAQRDARTQGSSFLSFGGNVLRSKSSKK